MPFRLPHPLPPYIMIFHTPGIRGKDRSFGVGWASSSCVIKNLCRAMAPQNGERVDMLNRNLAQFEDFVAKPTQDAADRSTSRSVLFVFSMHALRSIDTAHWTMHSLEIDGAVIARHVSAGVEQRELSAAPKRGNGGTAGKGKQRDKSRLAMAGLEKRIVDDSALFWSTDDNCVLKGAPTLSTCAKTSPECVAVTTADGHRNVYEMPSQKELAVFRDATRAVDLDPASEATADAKPDGPPGLNAGSGTGDGDGGSGIPGKDSDKETRMRRLVHELQRLNRAAEDKLTAERERGEAERKRLVAEHMHDLGELRKQLQEARDTALEHARNTKVLVDDAKRAETDAQAALRDSDAQLKQERARAGQLERDLEDTRAKLHTARGEREVARGKCKELQRQQTRNAETFNTATTTLKQQVSALSKDLEDQKRGRKAESVQHAAELQACQAKHDEAVEWRRLAQQETDGAIAKLTERLDEAEKAREVAEGDRVATLKLVERLENEARTAPPAAHAETQTPAPPPAAPAFSVQVVELEKRFSHLYEAYVKDVGRNPPEIPAPPAGSDHARRPRRRRATTTGPPRLEKASAPSAVGGGAGARSRANSRTVAFAVAVAVADAVGERSRPTDFDPVCPPDPDASAADDAFDAVRGGVLRAAVDDGARQRLPLDGVGAARLWPRGRRSRAKPRAARRTVGPAPVHPRHASHSRRRRLHSDAAASASPPAPPPASPAAARRARPQAAQGRALDGQWPVPRQLNAAARRRDGEWSQFTSTYTHAHTHSRTHSRTRMAVTVEVTLTVAVQR